LLGAAVLAPKLGRRTLQLGSVLQGAGLVLILVVLAHTQMHVTSWDRAGPLLLWGIGLGLVIAPLFDFVLAALTEDEIGSGSGVLNALQQLGSAIGVAVIGTVFFSTLNSHANAAGDPGYVAGFERSVQVGLGIAAVVYVLTFLLPRKARELDDAAPDGERRPQLMATEAAKA
jgi:MFS family permease